MRSLAERLSFTLLVILCAACETNDSGSADCNGDCDDIIRPSITSMTPEAGATDVSTSTTLVVVFSEEMDPASMSDMTIQLSPTLPGTSSLTQTTLTWTPARPLDPDTEYTATVATNLRDLAGNSLSGNTSWTFGTTASLVSCAPRLVEPGAFYVDQDHAQASNSNNGSASSPWLTIQHGVNQLSPGDTLYVKASILPYFEPYRASGNNMGGITIDSPGTSSDRIVIAAFPGERPVINQRLAQSSLSAEDGSPDSSPKSLSGFYLRDASYVTIRGFEITRTSASGIMFNQSGENTGSVIEENYIHHLFGRDNVGGVRLDNCIQCTVRNNLIHDTYDTRNPGSNPFNAEPYSLHSGVHGYRPGQCIVENNTIYNVAKGVFQKSPNPELLDANVVRNNLFYNITNAAFELGVQGSGSPPSYNASFHGNVVYDAFRGVRVLLSETDIQSDGMRVYNNTFYNVEVGAVEITGYHGIEFFNNIIVKTNNFNFITVDATGPPEGNTNTIDFLDNNLYFDHANKWLLDRYGASQAFDSLSAWQVSSTAQNGLGLSANPDLASTEVDPEFVEASAYNFRVLSTTAKTSGRNGGEIGAYGVTDNVGSCVAP